MTRYKEAPRINHLGAFHVVRLQGLEPGAH
jgi:hypothetical protein